MGKKANHSSDYGSYYLGDSYKLLTSELSKELEGKVNLILTSPPFPLNNKKSYGNLEGEEYKKWFVEFAEVFSKLLTDDGSIVIEMGNAWLPERPVQSLLHLETLIDFVNAPNANLRLCQQLICYNPSRLPSPAAWVTIRRIRLTDSYTNVWWMAKSDFPKADNRNVLRGYSKSMKKLLQRQDYNRGRRPSEHIISENGFLVNHGGSIMPNVLEVEQIDENKEFRIPNVLSLSNSSSNDWFMRECKAKGVEPHPARMPAGLAAFFIQFLTQPGDLVLDPFAGSNTTGYAAEKLKRRWVSIEMLKEYAKQSKIRFRDPSLHAETLEE